MLFKKLLRTAWSYKAQFISMVIMITIGVGIFLGFNIEWKSLSYDVSAFFEETKYADYRLYSENGFSNDDINAVLDIDGVDEATRYLSVNVSIKDTKKTVALNVSENYTVSTMHITEGKAYDEKCRGIWLSDGFASVNGIDIGDTLTFVYMGEEISGEVVGLVKSSENLISLADENQIMPDYTTHGFAYVSPIMLEDSIGFAFYPQINIISKVEKEVLEERVKDALGVTLLVTSKSEHIAYAGYESEVEEGKTMGLILPFLFLAIAVLTMVTTMHRIAANEKVQIGTLKALGFRDRKILWHYTSYGFVIGLIGTLLGIIVGYLVAAIIISPNGMMGTYFDMPIWDLHMPAFCIPVMLLMLLLLTFISFLSVKRMLVGTAADALRPYTPKAVKQTSIEKLPFFKKLSFGTKWNIRDIMRHKARSAMTLLGVFGCMLLLVGGLGMKDTMGKFIDMLDKDISNYSTKVNLIEKAENDEALALVKSLNGDWQASSGISYDGKTVSLDIYNIEHDKIRFLNEDDEITELENDGVYLCLRLKDSANIGDTIEFSPYGSDDTYKVKVAGYLRSPVSENIVMSADYADSLGIDYHISSIYTNVESDSISSSSIISGKQEKKAIIDSYDSFTEILYVMVIILVVAAVILGVVVLYNLGVMSYVERYRELATLKVLGFCDKKIGRLLISQNVWLTLVASLFGMVGGYGVLYILVIALASEYELSVTVSFTTYLISVLLTFGVSLAVGLAVSKKNKKINMVEALKDAE